MKGDAETQEKLSKLLQLTEGYAGSGVSTYSIDADDIFRRAHTFEGLNIVDLCNMLTDSSGIDVLPSWHIL